MFKTVSHGNFICGIYFPALFYIFLAIFTSIEIDDALVILLFAVNMASFGNVNIDEAEWIGMKDLLSSYSVVGGGIVPEPLLQALCHTRQHNMKHVPQGADNKRILVANMFRKVVYKIS